MCFVAKQGKRTMRSGMTTCILGFPITEASARFIANQMQRMGSEDENKCCCPGIQDYADAFHRCSVSNGSSDIWWPCYPHSGLEGCKTNSFMKGNDLQLESGYLCMVIPTAGVL